MTTNSVTSFRVQQYRISLSSGVYSRVARQLGLERSHVRRVALALRRSARVWSALEAEYNRIDKLVERYQKRLQKQAEKARLAA